MNINNGEIIGVPCSIQPGPFPHERFILVNAADGPLTGFADQADLHTDNGERGLLRAIVLDASKEAVKVHLFGSFFRTSGLAHVPRRGLAAMVA
ncbi:MAG: hypothetical protein WDO68_15970 [Gammaproteobacteria bacterium]